MSALQNEIDKLKTLRESYDELSRKVLDKQELLDTISRVSDEVLRKVSVSISYDGNVANDGYAINSVLSILANKAQITRLYDNSIVSIDKQLLVGNDITLPLGALGLTGVNTLRMEAINSIAAASDVCSGRGGEVRVAEFPNLTSFKSLYGRNFQSLKLEELYLPKLRIIGGQNTVETFKYSDNLIKIVIGENLNNSFSFFMWSPTNAMNADSASLVKQGESFTSNAEKFHYNLREFIAKNLPDRKAEVDAGGTAYTLTFATELGEFIASNEETYNAFINKGWVIAY